MPKRKREKLSHLEKAIKRLRKKIKRCHPDYSSSEDDSPRGYSSEGEAQESDVAVLPQEWFEKTQLEAPNEEIPTPPPVQSNIESTITLEPEFLEILGEDPACKKKFSPQVQPDLARRLEHIATEGLTKEKKKEILEKYLVPENWTLVSAPELNPEIKAALSDTFIKRDRGIFNKQCEMSGAIGGLAEVISSYLVTEDNNNSLSQQTLTKLMDIGRILCNIQHSDSVTRRNFIFFSLRKEMKDHLANTKIDKMLFSENLQEALKSAKAVSKSGIELKDPQTYKKKANKPSQPLNRKAPAPVRRPQGPTQRSREPAPYHSKLPAPPQQGHSSRRSSHTTRTSRR